MSLNDLAQDVQGVCKCEQARKEAQAGVDAATVVQKADGESQVVALTIDVSHLPPPLPMVRILETLRDLGPGETLVVHHARRPIHLYPKLEGLGCTHETTEQPNGAVTVRITNPLATPA